MSKQLTGRMVLICFLGFFALVAGVNGVMISLAISTFGGVEAANSYQAGLAFDREIAAAESQAARHWRVDASVSGGEDATLVAVTVRDADGRPPARLHATGRLLHPADRRADRNLTFDADGPGRFRAMAASLHGQWTLEIDLMRDGEQLFRSRNRVHLR